MILDFVYDLVDDIGFTRPIRMPPHQIPLLVKWYVYQKTTYKREVFFVVVLLALPSSGLPWTG